MRPSCRRRHGEHSVRRGDAGAAGETLRILFIGNSLTAANDLPDIVESFSKAARRP